MRCAQCQVLCLPMTWLNPFGVDMPFCQVYCKLEWLGNHPNIRRRLGIKPLSLTRGEGRHFDELRRSDR